MCVCCVPVVFWLPVRKQKTHLFFTATLYPKPTICPITGAGEQENLRIVGLIAGKVSYVLEEFIAE